MQSKSIDKTFLALAVLLALVGFAIFISASLGLLAREGVTFSRVASTQLVFGLIGGSLAMFFAANTSYRFWKQHALWLFVGACVISLFVFIPGLGLGLKGAHRWISLGSFTLQPSELLKIGYVMYLAMWLANARRTIGDWRFGLLPFLGISGIIAIILLLQKDTDTLVISLTAGLAMFVASGARARDIAIVFLVAFLALGAVVMLRPYVLERIQTFLDPSADPLGASYQIQQSLIAVGSGGVFGRGFGQSVQKFDYLPEPIGDSIFAVAAEEFGFIGSTLLIGLFLSFVIRGLLIARRAKDPYGGLLATGIVVLIGTQAFWNIAAMLGVVPLSGLPLVFVSHGGTALLFALFSVGVVLNVSRHREAVV
jgi:cell division protein FtsW